jgi:hypothetical protein
LLVIKQTFADVPGLADDVGSEGYGRPVQCRVCILPKQGWEARIPTVQQADL